MTKKHKALNKNIQEIIPTVCTLKELSHLNQYISEKIDRILSENPKVIDSRIDGYNQARILELKDIQEDLARRCQILSMQYRKY